MKKATPEQLEAFARLLAGDPDFAAFLAWLRDSLAEADVANRRLEEPHLKRSQGCALTCEEILETLETAKRRRAGPAGGSG